MKSNFLVLVCSFLCAAAISSAAVPPAEQLLPADTLAVVSIPDWSKIEAARQDAPMYLLWNDPAMRPFRDKFVAKLTKDVIEPLEQQLGLKLADYAGLLRGQFTVAITQNGWTGTSDPVPAFLLILDAKDKSDLLKKNLTDVRQKLTDAGKKLRMDKIRDVEFTTLLLDPTELGKSLEKSLNSGKGADTKPAASDSKPAEAAKPLELSFGQADSLLLVGSSSKDLEKVLARVAGSGAAPLGELPAYESLQRTFFRDASSMGWIHLAPVLDVVTKMIPKPAEAPAGQPAPPSADKIIAALGLGGLRSMAFAGRQTPEGASVDLLLAAPADGRKGLFRLIATEPKDATPPGFVPADAVQFTRWRVDGQKFWAAIEAMANELAPGMLGFLTGQLEAVLKEKDPGFDFKKGFVGNLGDDLVSFQKAPRGNTLQELNSPPSITLIGSPNPEQLIQFVKSAMLMLPPPLSGGEFKEREFLGRKIHSLPLPSMPAGDGNQAKETSLNLVASGGYLAIITDTGLVEEYLRSGENKPKPLAEKAGLADASQKVGGMGTGLFGYQNDAENMRVLIEALKGNADFLAKAFSMSPIPLDGDKEKMFKEWLDLSLLPPYEKISRYFNHTVFAGSMSADGYQLKVYTPTPPQMRQ